MYIFDVQAEYSYVSHCRLLAGNILVYILDYRVLYFIRIADMSIANLILIFIVCSQLFKAKF